METPQCTLPNQGFCLDSIVRRDDMDSLDWLWSIIYLTYILTDTIFQQESTTTVYTETYDDPENIITHLHQLHFSEKYQYSHQPGLQLPC
jgi:hypothetical protein